jgi:hypothetical protein
MSKKSSLLILVSTPSFIATSPSQIATMLDAVADVIDGFNALDVVKLICQYAV